MTELAIAPMAPSDKFSCQKYSCTLTARVCVLRQREKRVWNGGTSQGKSFRKVYTPQHLEYCASGLCARGRAIAAAVSDQAIEKPRPVDALAQYRAKRRAMKPILPPAVFLPREVDPSPALELPQALAADPIAVRPPPRHERVGIAGARRAATGPSSRLSSWS